MLSFPKEANSEPISISKDTGINIGDAAQGGLKLKIDILCAADATAEKELAVSLETGMHLNIQMLWDDFTIYAKFLEPEFMGTVATPYTIDLDYHNWDSQLTAVLKVIAMDLNIRYGDVYDLRNNKKFGSLIQYASMNIKHSLLSPFLADEFIFAGFSDIKAN